MMKRLFSLCLRSFERRPFLWLVCWCAWFGLLWYLSSTNPAPKDLPRIPHLDKVVHFTYFAAGGFMLCCWWRGGEKSRPWLQAILVAWICGSLMGALDEWHQSGTEGRSGNDLGDWIADCLGSLAGGIACAGLFPRVSGLLVKTSEKNTKKSEL